MKPDVKKIIADIKATKGNRKFCNGLAGTLQDDNYASSICKYVKTVTPERIDLLIEYAEKLEAEVTDMAVQLANADSKCRELAVENSAIKVMNDCLSEEMRGYESDGAFEGPKMHLLWWKAETPATDAFLAEVRAQSASELIAAFSKHVSASGLNDSSVVTILECEDAMQHVAAQLRKGAAL
ncbi:hypothetical protein M8U53_24980 [Enterobacter hormaechei]|uniref:hypothetical protein n=1 Tax=Enterobacter hormaechei TaxID=158836 RepID=UPI0020750050|nr:hypothetical protein [Enterobacter hormaechei]MCM8294787.1 hypothetical protein [Enterobacter hormaechei]MDF3746555.1 hypothetical protein [Enterobacter hormaechei]